MRRRSVAGKAVTSAVAEPEDAARHFAAKLAYETDCWDVHAALEEGRDDFVLLDVRSPGAYSAGHVPGAVNLPHGLIDAPRLEALSPDGVFVVYCAGPHCNGADKAAVAISTLGRRVKIMIGGHHGWQVEGFALETGQAAVTGPPS